MKKNLTFILLLALLSIGNLLKAQSLDSKYFTGYWSSDKSSTRLVFFIDINDKLQLVEWDSKGGEEMEIIDMKIDGNKIKTTERFKSMNHVTFNEYILSDENKIENIISGDANTTIYFNRLK